MKDMDDNTTKWCCECETKTPQKIILFDPDHPEFGEVYQCIICFEHTGWVELL